MSDVKKDHSIGAGTGAVGGALTGAAIGSAAGPVGSLVGAAVGGVVGAKSLVDPAVEIHELERQIAELHAQIKTKEKAAHAIEVERDAVLGALATAVPTLKDGGDRLGVALARVDWLVKEIAKGPSATSSGGPVKKVVPDVQDTIPSNELLAAIATGSGGFTKEQREWSVGEAMVISGFQFTPVELIQKGDTAVAQMIVAARKG